MEEEYDKIADFTTKEEKLKTDASLTQIKMISEHAFEIAIKRLNGEKVEENIDLESITMQMKELLNSVYAYNDYYARTLVSEAILDYNFYNNPTSEISSLRLGRIIENKKRN